MLKIILKVLLGLLLIIGAGLIALQVFIKFYFTQSRLISLIIPQIEQATHRKASLENIKISLFSGLKLHNLILKEQNGQDNFLKITDFSLSYSLLPLLHKQLVITAITLHRPEIQIIRQKDGKFNFSSLIPPGQSGPSKHPSSRSTKAPDIQNTRTGLALTIDKVVITDGRLVFSDLQNKLPRTTVELNSQVSLTLDQYKTLDYQGQATVKVKAMLHDLANSILLKVDFNPQKTTLDGDLALDRWTILATGTIQDYQQGPKIQLDLRSPELDIDQLLKKIKKALPQNSKIPEAAQTGKKDSQQPVRSDPRTDSYIPLPLPKGLEARAGLTVQKLLYHGIEAKDVTLKALLKNGLLHLQKDIGSVLAGRVQGQVDTDLTKPSLPFNGELHLQGIMPQNIPQLAASRKYLNGTLSCDLTYNGQAMPLTKLLERLNLSGRYALHDGQIQETPLSTALSSLLHLPELGKLSFKSLQGNLELNKGKLVTKSAWFAHQFNATVEKGKINIVNGGLDLPLSITLNKQLSQKLVSRNRYLKYLLNDQNQAHLPLTIKGTYKHPRLTLHGRDIKKRIKKEVKNKVRQKLNRLLRKSLPEHNSTTQTPDLDRIFNGLFSD